MKTITKVHIHRHGPTRISVVDESRFLVCVAYTQNELDTAELHVGAVCKESSTLPSATVFALRA